MGVYLLSIACGSPVADREVVMGVFLGVEVGEAVQSDPSVSCPRVLLDDSSARVLMEDSVNPESTTTPFIDRMCAIVCFKVHNPLFFDPLGVTLAL
jgi:hypothetical protein